MNLTEMRASVRKDLHDEDEQNYRWTDDELDRHIAHAVKEFSEALPLEQKAVVATTSGSREIDLSGITGRVMVQAVEYPADKFPPRYQRFSLWGELLTLLGEETPDGSDCNIYYGKLHTLDEEGSTLAEIHQDLVATGACGFAAVAWSVNAINKVNAGGIGTPADFVAWGKDKLLQFRRDLKKLGRRNRVRVTRLYIPQNAPVSKTTDWGP